MQPSGIITLLSDFGLSDPFVGVMKGVILQWFPEAKLLDLTHEIAAQDVLGAAFWLAAAEPWFAPGTVHLCVVDPGVGGLRAPLAMRAHGHVFVGPDNGLFDLVCRRAPADEVRSIDAERLGFSLPSRTFHGRDLFAPVAALLAASKLPFDELGPVAEPQGKLAWPAVSQSGARQQGQVIVVDRFGNLISNIEPEAALAPGSRALVGATSIPCRGTYSDVQPGELVAYVGSFGQLEIALRDGSAAAHLGAARGTPLSLEGP